MQGPEKKRGVPGCLWKAPLGCFAFALGGGVVLSLLLPYACGTVAGRALERDFDRTHQGSLSIEEARVGALVGRQGFQGVVLRAPDGAPVLDGDLELPSLRGLFSDAATSRVAELTVRRVDLREVLDAAGAPTTNLQLALRPKASVLAASAEAAADPPAPPAPADASEAPAPAGGDTADRKFDASVRLGGDEASLRFGEDRLSLDGVEDLDLRGSVQSLRWTDAAGELRVLGDDLALRGTLRQVGEEAQLTLQVEGPVAPPDAPADAATLSVSLRWESREGGDLQAAPSAVDVELTPLGDTAAPPEPLVAAVARALELLGSGTLQREGDAARWVLVEPAR